MGGTQSKEDSLRRACYEGKVSTLEKLLKQGASPEQRDPQSNTLLHIAAAKCSAELTQVLLHYRATPDAQGQYGYTPLILASIKGSSAVVSTLMGHNADPLLLDSTGNTALHWASERGFAEVVTTLLTKSDPALEIHRALGRSLDTPLHCAIRAAKFDAVEALINNGANTDVPAGPEHDSPLHTAARIGSKPMLQLLVSESGQAATGAATAARAAGVRVRPVDVLTNRRAYFFPRNASGETPLAIARRFEFNLAIEFLRPLCLAQYEREAVALSAAIVANDATAVAALIKGGVDVNATAPAAQDSAVIKGVQWPLLVAVQRGNLACTKLLLQGRADPNRPSSAFEGGAQHALLSLPEGSATAFIALPLVEAARAQNTALVHMLLQHGAGVLERSPVYDEKFRKTMGPIFEQTRRVSERPERVYPTPHFRGPSALDAALEAGAAAIAVHLRRAVVTNPSLHLNTHSPQSLNPPLAAITAVTSGGGAAIADAARAAACGVGGVGGRSRSPSAYGPPVDRAPSPMHYDPNASNLPGAGTGAVEGTNSAVGTPMMAPRSRPSSAMPRDGVQRFQPRSSVTSVAPSGAATPVGTPGQTPRRLGASPEFGASVVHPTPSPPAELMSTDKLDRRAPDPSPERRPSVLPAEGLVRRQSGIAAARVVVAAPDAPTPTGSVPATPVAPVVRLTSVAVAASPSSGAPSAGTSPTHMPPVAGKPGMSPLAGAGASPGAGASIGLGELSLTALPPLSLSTLPAAVTQPSLASQPSATSLGAICEDSVVRAPAPVDRTPSSIEAALARGPAFTEESPRVPPRHVRSRSQSQLHSRSGSRVGSRAGSPVGGRRSLLMPPGPPDALVTAQLIANLSSGDGDGAAMLLRQRADPNAVIAETGQSLLLLATEAGLSTAVEALLEAGADPCGRAVGATPAGTPTAAAGAGAEYGDERDDLDFLLQEDEDDEDGEGRAGGRRAGGGALTQAHAQQMQLEDVVITPLQRAAALGHSEIASLLIKFRAPASQRTTVYDMSPLHLAAHEGREGVVKVLLAARADINCKDDNGNTPLHAAADVGQMPVVMTLLGAKAAVRIANDHDKTPLQLAKARDHTAVAHAIMKARVQIATATFRKDDVQRALLEHQREHALQQDQARASGADAEEMKQQQPAAATAAAAAALSASGSTATTGKPVKPLVPPPSVAVRALKPAHGTHGSDGDATAAALAAARGSRVDALANVTSAALAASGARSQKTETEVVVRALAAARADLHVSYRNGFTALHDAAQKGMSDVVQILVTDGHMNPNAASDTKETPLILAAYSGHDSVAAALLRLKADVDLSGRSGATPLLYAVQRGHLSVVRALMAARATPDLAGLNGDLAPLHWAARRGRADIAAFLLASKAQPDVRSTARGATPLVLAAAEGHAEVVRALLDAKASVSSKDNAGNTALSLAAGSMVHSAAPAAAAAAAKSADGSSPKAAAAAAAPGAAEKATPRVGPTKPVVAPEKDHALVTVELLLKAKADPNALAAGQQSAVHVAAAAGRWEILDALIFGGGSFSVKNGAGRKAYDIALAAGNKPLADAIRKAKKHIKHGGEFQGLDR